MAVQTGAHYIEGAYQVLGNNVAGSGGLGPFSKAGAPSNGDFNNSAAKGALLVDTTNAVLYQNTGTLTATVWSKVGLET